MLAEFTMSTTEFAASSKLPDEVPLRRGPLVTLSRLWSVVPYPKSNDDGELPDPHDTFMRYFRYVLRKDHWLVAQIDSERWSNQRNHILEYDQELNRLSIDELRNLITYEDRGESYSPGSLAQSIEYGEIQRFTARLSELVWPDKYVFKTKSTISKISSHRKNEMNEATEKHLYTHETKPKRRGPLTTLAYLWAVVPVSRSEAIDLVSNQVLPEPHQTFIQTFKEIMERDDWLITNIDQKRWDNSLFILLNDPDSIKKLSVMELRDILTYFNNLDESWGSEGILDQLTRSGQLQKVLLRLSHLISPELYE